MSGAVSFAFALGLLAPLAPIGVPWAVAAIGLSAGSASGPSVGSSLRHVLRGGALAGLVFAFVALLGAWLYELGIDLAEALTIPNLVLSVGLAGFGIGLAFRPTGSQYAPTRSAVIVLAVAYAIVSLPGVVGILHRLLERSAEQGTGGVIGAAALTFAGAVTAFATFAALGSLLGRALGGARRAFSAAAILAGATASAIYWLPGSRGDVDDPGSGLGEALADISRDAGEVIAQNLMIPALLFLAGAVWTLLRAARPGRA